MITLIRRNDNYEGELRFRYYRDNDEDEKSFYGMNFKTNDEKVAIETVIGVICHSNSIPSNLVPGLISYDFLEVGGDMMKFVEEAKKQKKPWLQMTILEVPSK